MDKKPAPECMEEQAKQIFDIQMTPEVYAARWSHTIACSSFGEFIYRYKKLQEWIYMLHEILSGNYHKTVAELRKQYLSKEELEKIESEMYEF